MKLHLAILRSSPRQSRAFTIIELLVVIATLAVLVAGLCVRLAKEKQKAQRASCTGKLKITGLGFRTWSTDNGDKFPMATLTNRTGALEALTATNIFRFYQVMSNELNNPSVICCAADTRIRANDFVNLSNLNISYFVALDADETNPAMPLIGDRNLTTNGVTVNPGLVVTRTDSTNSYGFSSAMHKRQANVGLSDGSVQQVSSAGLQTLIQKSGTNTVRLGVP